MRWDTKQIALLRIYAPDGAEVCAGVIAAECGVRRSAAATARYAYRLGLSLKKTYTCGCCGGRARKINARTGFCPTCHYRHLADEERVTRAQIVRLANETDRATQAAKREYDRLRKENHRKSQQTGISRKHAKKAWDRRTRNVTK